MIMTIVLMFVLLIIMIVFYDMFKTKVESEGLLEEADKKGAKIDFCERCGNLLTTDEYKICGECVHKMNEVKEID